MTKSLWFLSKTFFSKFYIFFVKFTTKVTEKDLYFKRNNLFGKKSLQNFDTNLKINAISNEKRRNEIYINKTFWKK